MNPIIKDLGVIILIGLLLLWSFLAAIERLIFFNTNLYPDFLVNTKDSLESKEKMFELIKLTCPRVGLIRLSERTRFIFGVVYYGQTHK